MYKAGVLTCSDSAFNGTKEDSGGPLIQNTLKEAGFDVLIHKIVPDDIAEISNVFRKWSDLLRLDLIISTGGTGLSPRDVTPEATELIMERDIPGIAEAIRHEGLKFTPRAMLSRAKAVTRGTTLIINLPGSPKAIKQCFDLILPILPHAISKINGDTTPCAS